MGIEIDQSGKIENTNRKTVIAFSNGKSGAVVILASEKKKIQKYFRSLGKPKLFIHITFTVLVFMLIKNKIRSYDQIIIDREYPGYEKLIAGLLRKLLSADNTGNVSIATSQIGKKSKAHDLAWKELQSKKSNTKKIKYQEIIKLIKKSGSI